MYHTVTG